LGDFLYENPELGYKEFIATEEVSKRLEDLGLNVNKNIARTGCVGKTQKKDGPTIGVLGELDAVICHEHVDSDLVTGAVHACGHNIQVGVMYGIAIGLLKSGIMDQLNGNVYFYGVPAEECIDLGFREKLVDNKEIRYYGGKQELISKGYFDEVQLCLMMHSQRFHNESKVELSSNTLGFNGKRITYYGVEAHAGAYPQEGINALNAATIGLIFVKKSTILTPPFLKNYNKALLINVNSNFPNLSYSSIKTN
jgi:amidohydrolase